MENIEEQIINMKREIEQQDLVKSIEIIEKIKKILDEPNIKPIFDKDNNVIEEFSKMLNIFKDEITNAKNQKEELKSELFESSMHHIKINFDNLERKLYDIMNNSKGFNEIMKMSRTRILFDMVLKLSGCCFSGYLSYICINEFIKLAETNIIMAIPAFLGGCLLAGATCAIASGNSVELPDYIEGMKMFGGKKKMWSDSKKNIMLDDKNRRGLK